MPSNRKQNIEKIRQWKAENIDLIRFEARKELHFPDRIAAQVSRGNAGSRQEYIINAVLKQLQADETETG